jgi:hypothetical protein
MANSAPGYLGPYRTLFVCTRRRKEVSQQIAWALIHFEQSYQPAAGNQELTAES